MRIGFVIQGILNLGSSLGLSESLGGAEVREGCLAVFSAPSRECQISDFEF